MKELIRRFLVWCIIYGWIVILLMGMSFYLGAEFVMWHCYDNR